MRLNGRKKDNTAGKGISTNGFSYDIDLSENSGMEIVDEKLKISNDILSNYLQPNLVAYVTLNNSQYIKNDKTWVKILFNNIESGIFNTSLNQHLIQRSGIYLINIYIDVNQDNDMWRGLAVYKNNSIYRFEHIRQTKLSHMNFCTMILLNKNDLLSFYINSEKKITMLNNTSVMIFKLH